MEREWVVFPVRACRNIGFKHAATNFDFIYFFLLSVFFYLLELNDKENKMG